MWSSEFGDTAGLEFRSYQDEAWYNVTVEVEGGDSVRIRFAGFPTHDVVYAPGDFGLDPKRVDDFAARFRPVSIQLQDYQCTRATSGLLVCASHHFGLEDVRFHDALIDSVDRATHSINDEGEEECQCGFNLSWLHGPNTGNITGESIAQICRVQFRAEIDPVVASFVSRARERFESPSPRRKLPQLDNHRIKAPALRIGHKLSFSHHSKQETKRLRWSFNDELWSTWTFGYPTEKSGEDSDLGGVGNHYLVVVENLEIGLTPLAMMEFLRGEVSVLAQAFVAPSLKGEICTHGNIVVDSKEKFQKLCAFLNNSCQFIVSALGRPWVMTETMTVHNTLRATIETNTLISQNIIENRESESTSRLKVVRLGSDQYKAAKDLSDVYKEFSSHHQKIHKRLIVEEGKIWMKHNAERRVGI